MDNKRIAIFGGGTVSHVRNHLALCAPAYGSTAKKLAEMAKTMLPRLDVALYLTKMAGGNLETNEDIAAVVDNLIADDKTRIIIMSAALCDFNATVLETKKYGYPESQEIVLCGNRSEEQGKHATRLQSSNKNICLELTPAEKVISRIRKQRKDIFLVGFKTTCGATEDEQYIAGLDLCKKNSCNLVLANDTKTRLNMVISPEEARYHVTTDRNKALHGLMEMTKLRSHLTFTRSTVIEGNPVPWNSELVPESLRKVVDYCIERNAYKPFNGSTAGHFAVKVNDTTFLTSQRKTNFNNLKDIGLVKIVTDGPDTVLAYGAKPSVGGQSQRIVFKDHAGMDCIVHFHCPIKEGSEIPQVSQYEVECGSHECGNQTSKGLQQFGNLKAVYLKEHGPNIVFNRNIDPNEVIKFIDDNFDLSKKTGGFVSLRSRLETSNVVEDAIKTL